jgi:SynChlorMet cassette protein ScmC
VQKKFFEEAGKPVDEELSSTFKHRSYFMKVNKTILGNKSGYCMRLANGQGWYLVATEGVGSWLEKLASIMQLDNCDPNGYPKLIFSRKEKGEEWLEEPICCLPSNLQEKFPSSGWKIRKSHAIQIWSHGDVPDVFCEIGDEEGHDLDILRMLLALHPIFERAQYSGGLPFHAALIERNGIGILLAAPGNTGKSTCCRRLRGLWNPVCDDETLVVRDDQKRYLVHPLPTWSDYLMKRSQGTWNVQKYLPLSAIFFLEQAETDEVVPIGQGQAATLAYRSVTQVCHRDWMNLDREELRAYRKKIFENTCELAGAVPAFKLRVSLKGRFWEEIEKVLF